MEDATTSRRVPWIALVLSFLAAGVGHVYCGRVFKGLLLYFAWILIPICTTIAAVGQPSWLGLALIVLPAVFVFMVYIYAAIDAWRLADHLGSGYSLRDCNRTALYWLLIFVRFVFTIGMVAWISGSVYEVFIVPSKSMSPTILAGDRIIARKFMLDRHVPQRGDLIVYRNPTKSKAVAFVGRITALAGDEIQVLGNRVSVNGKTLETDRVPIESIRYLGDQSNVNVVYEENSGRRYMVAFGEPPNDESTDEGSSGDESSGEEKSGGDVMATVPDRHVFVLGDHRSRSLDSREHGPISTGDIIGYVDYISWPSKSWSRFGVANDRLP